MKTYIKYLFIALAFLACDNDDDNNNDNPIDQLPPMTTTGENTIGCLVNGEPFTDSGLMNNFYQFVGGDYFLVINWEKGFPGNFKDGQISIRNTEIEEGETYLLNYDNSTGEDFIGGSANYTFVKNSNSGEYNTNPNYFGEITFNRFDNVNNIMSGVFEFEAEDINTGEIILITNGRFDLTFTN